MAKTDIVFSKEQILKMRRFAYRQDLLSVLLLDGKFYSIEAVQKIIDDFMKGKVD